MRRIKILDGNYYDSIINNAIVPICTSDDNITYIDERYALTHLPTVGNICSLGTVPYHIFPNLFKATSPTNLGVFGIISIQEDLHLDLRNLGVLVSTIDIGTDYTRPAFHNLDSTPRVTSIWGQINQNGMPPGRFTSDTGYQTEGINHALSSDIPHSIVPVSDPVEHDTSPTSIIAGNPNGTVSLSGIALESELVIVKLKRTEEGIEDIFCAPNDVTCHIKSDIMLRVRYLYTISQALKRPIVICLVLGNNQGGHDGNGTLSSYLDYLSWLPWIGISISAGDEGVVGRHYFHTTMTMSFQDSFELLVEDGDHEFPFKIWSSYSRLSVEIFTPNRETT